MEYGQAQANAIKGAALGAANNTINRETLATLIDSIDGHLANAHDILQRLGKVADHVGGSVPQDAAKDNHLEPEESALSHRLRRKIATLSNLHSGIFSELCRLEQAV